MKQFFQLVIIVWTVVYLLSGDYQKQTGQAISPFNSNLESKK
jgi:hypothetical protein